MSSIHPHTPSMTPASSSTSSAPAAKMSSNIKKVDKVARRDLDNLQSMPNTRIIEDLNEKIMRLLKLTDLQATTHAVGTQTLDSQSGMRNTLDVDIISLRPLHIELIHPLPLS